MKKCGFTLIETIITISIMLVLAAVLITQINDKDPADLLSDNKKVMINVLKLARTYALSGRYNSGVAVYGYGVAADITTDSGKYYLYADRTTDADTTFNTDEIIETYIFDSKIKIASNFDILFTSYQGQVSEEGTITIADYYIDLYHEDSPSVIEQIKISGLSGQIENE